MGKIAFVFSGQGAQYTGMGQDLFKNSKEVKEIFNLADSIRPKTSGQCFFASKEELSKTINTQPCVFTVSLAAAKAVEEKGITPDYLAGFSLGEVTALAYSSIISYEEAFRLVIKRAEFMEEAAKNTKGAMVAIMRLSTDEVEEICKEIPNTYPVNYNSPQQTVVATTEENVETLIKKTKDKKGRGIKLNVSGAFHSLFMEEAAESLKDYLKDINFKDPAIPIYSNVTGKPYAKDYKDLLVKQIKSPVQWEKTILNLINKGVDTFIEVGPGKTLTGIISKIKQDVKTFKVENYEDVENLCKALQL